MLENRHIRYMSKTIQSVVAKISKPWWRDYSLYKVTIVYYHRDISGSHCTLIGSHILAV